MRYNGRLDLQTLSHTYRWNPENNSVEGHVAELKDLFKRDPNATPSRLRKILGEHFHQPDRFFRSSGERKAARQLTQRLQEKMFTHIANSALVEKQIQETQSGAATISKLARAARFIRTDLESNDAKDFNDKLIQYTEQHSNDPKPLQDLLLGELGRLRKNLGLDDPENIKKLGALTDAEIVEKYEDLVRYHFLLLEAADSNSNWIFTPEQCTALQEEYNKLEYLQNFVNRCTIISNPYYEDINLERLHAQKIDSSLIFRETVPKYIRDTNVTNSAQNVLRTFLDAAQSAYSMPRGLAAQAAALNPELAEHLNQDSVRQDFTAALASGSPYVVLDKNNREYVITNRLTMDKIPTAEEYTQDLIDQAIQADKFLLTGSKQFKDMLDTMKCLKEAELEAGSNKGLKQLRALRELSGQVEKYTKEYLKYKNPNFTEYTGPSSVRGKNMREQTRLEVAGKYLNYAQARFKMLDTKIKALEKEIEEAKKNEKHVARKKRVLEDSTVDVVSAKGKLNFIGAHASNFNKMFGREKPLKATVTKTMEGNEEVKKVSHKTLISQEEYEVLCALALGSPNAYYKAPKEDKPAPKKKNDQVQDGAAKKDVDYQQAILQSRQEEIVMNTNPEQTFRDMLMAIGDSLKIDEVPRDLRAMSRGVISLTYHAMTNGKFDKLGVMLAEGLKHCNQVLQAQPSFTHQFYTCAKMAANLSKVLENPGLEDLKKVVLENADPKDLEIAKACRGIYNVIEEGILAQKMLLTRVNMTDNKGFDRGDGINDRGILDDIAKICHMYGLERQFAGNLLKLDSSNYTNVPDFAKNTNQKLAESKNISDFADQLQQMQSGERLNAIWNTQKMGDLFQNSMEEIKKIVQNQQHQPSSQISNHVEKQVQQSNPTNALVNS